MTSAPRLLSALTVLAGLVLVAGCATSSPGQTAPSSTTSPSSGPSAESDDVDIEGALLDDGRMFAVVTQGSSSLACAPRVTDVSAAGQVVSVTVEDTTDPAVMCTADYAPRASVGALPAGVDPTAEITLNVTYGDIVDDVDLDGDAAFTGAPGSATEYLPSAGWFDDDALVLLTWGSSSCPPVVESVDGAGAAGTVTLVTDEGQVCTMDMAPRATVIAFGDDQVDDDGFTLTLIGGGLDGSVAVRG